MAIMETLKTLVWILSSLLTIYGIYYAFMLIFTFLPLKERVAHGPRTKFAVVVAARNEEAVIGNLVDSLFQQNYPRELYDVIVAPNNCRDNTKGVAEEHGAMIFEPKSVIRSKGDVLKELFASLLRERPDYEAFVVFDADNVADPDFLRNMNSALVEGAEVAQGYRDSKNPYTTYMASCSTIYYYMVNRFLNRPRNAIGLSGMINGTGFAVKADVLRALGGYNTRTLTEDIEFSTQVILSGRKVEWVPNAITYDEQPEDFLTSWKQRKRWTLGLIQCGREYLGELLRNLTKGNFLQVFDFTMFHLGPLVQILSIFSGLAITALSIVQVYYDQMTTTTLVLLAVGSTVLSYVGMTVVPMVLVALEKRSLKKAWKGILTFGFFLMSWLPINVLCFIKPDTTWHEIKHKQKVSLNRKA